MKTQVTKRCSCGGFIESDNAKLCPWCNKQLDGTECLPNQSGPVASSHTVQMGGISGETQIYRPPHSPATPPPKPSGTIIVGDRGQKASTPRIVGFLLSYTLEPQGFFYPIREGRQTIGTARTNHVCIVDGLLSSEHALILYRNGRFIFEDKMSSNGSFLNGKELIGQVELVHGDRLTLGSHIFILLGVPQDEIKE